MEDFGVDVEILKQICYENADFFEKDETENGQRLRLAFLGIIDHVNSILPSVITIKKIMSSYDFDEETPGNGYRSFVVVVDASIKHAFQLSNYVAANRGSVMFKKGFYMKEMEAVCHMIASLGSCFQHLNTLLTITKPGDLFPFTDNHSQILEQSDTINQYAFYGRCLGIQFCSSVQPLLKFISVFMASFSEIYYNIGSLSARAQSLLTGGKFILDPELRAKRIVNISLYASIDFCKSFWFLAESELMKKIPDFVCDAIAINTEIKIPPEPLEAPSSGGAPVKIPLPSSHVGVNSIQVRLLSSCRREGMIGSKKTAVLPASDSLILHCHGGGFVAQSSKSHEVYLRDWASNLEVPIVSVDYSLAPEAPFPRALEEVFYTYCWILKNCHILGSTGQKIIFAGDSAGANLLLGATLKCIEFDIRKPDGLFLAYVPVIVSSTPSPSRLLSLMDPLLPIGFMLRCLKAYACPSAESGEKMREPVNGEALDFKETVPENIICCVDSVGNSDPNSSLKSDEDGAFVKPVCDIAECSIYPPSSVDFENNEYCPLANEKDEKQLLGKVCENDQEAGKGAESVESTEKHLKSAFSNVRSRVSNLFSRTFKGRKDIDKTLIGTDIERRTLVNPFEEFKFSVPKDPYLSPYWASDEILKQLPPTKICSVQFDPCLDDCVMFSKKLKNLGNSVTLDILEGLPHGFLNFSKVNKDAAEGSKHCIRRIKELLIGETLAAEGETKNQSTAEF